jgi:hypothetical protein
MKIVEGVAANKDPSLPVAQYKTRKEGSTSMAKIVGYSLLPILASTKRTFENASPLDPDILTAKSPSFYIDV